MKWLLLVLVACGSLTLGGCADDRPPSEPVEASDSPGGAGGSVADKPKKTIEGYLSLEVETIEAASDGIKKHVGELGGKVLVDEASGVKKHLSYAKLRVRVPADKTDEFVAWVDKRYDIISKSIKATDVAGELRDFGLHVANLEAALAKLRKLAQEPGIKLAEVLTIETEMRRLETELAQIKAAKKALEEQVAFSTFNLDLHRPWDPEDSDPRAKMGVGLRAAHLTLVDHGGGSANGGGFSIGVPKDPSFSLDVDLFQKKGSDRPVLVTLGGGAYSDYLGRGRREFLNPWLGFRFGYGFAAEKPATVVGFELGVELVKYKLLSASVFGRGMDFLRKDGSALASETGFILKAPF